MRKATGSVICPNCERLIGASEPRCPYCGALQASVFGVGPSLQRALRKLDLAMGVIVVCGALYVIALLLVPSAIFRMRGIFDILSPAGGALDVLGMTGAHAFAQGRWWTVFTAIFLHGSVLHILFNMVILRQYLPNVSELYGPVRAWVIFLISGAVGFVVSNLASGTPTIGASGSIFGMLAALIVFGRRSGQHTVTRQLWMSAGVMFLYGFLMPSINNWAHAGGFASGFVAAEAMAFANRRESPVLLALAAALTLVTLAGFVMEGLRFLRMMGI